MKNKVESEKDEGFLFEIYDYAHLNMLLSAMAMLSLIFLFGILQVIGVVDSSVYTGMSRALITFLWFFLNVITSNWGAATSQLIFQSFSLSI